jgi:hypothetical protein
MKLTIGNCAEFSENEISNIGSVVEEWLGE